MNSKNPFKWRYFEKAIILLNVRCYLRYTLSYRDLEEMMLERGEMLTTRTSTGGFKAIPRKLRKDANPTSNPLTNQHSFVLVAQLAYVFVPLDFKPPHRVREHIQIV